MDKKVKEGIALYNIENDGSLNGVYTSRGVLIEGNTYNESAKRKPGHAAEDGEDIAGVYDSVYVDDRDGKSTLVNAELKITKDKSEVYLFTWTDPEGKVLFTGTGYKMNKDQVAVRYMSQ